MELSKVRVGDAERTAAVDQIIEQHALGRLETTEADVRVNAALGAQTIGELHLLTADLPRASGSPATQQRVGRWQQRGTRAAFPAFCLVAGGVATTAATDSVAVGVISLIAGTCGVVLGRYSKGDA